MRDNIFIKRIYREKTIKRFNDKIKKLSISVNYNSIDLLNIRFILTILIFVVAIVTSSYGYFLAPLLSVCFYFLYEYYFLDYKIKKRRELLESDALYYFEVLALTLEGGRNLKKAIELTSNSIDSELSNEFKRMLHEVELGKSLNEALKKMKERIPSDVINNAILNIRESNIFGNSIMESLYNQLDFLRENKIMAVKGEIAKMPTKVSVISVVFFIPIMLLLILAPVVINYMFS